MSWRKIEKELVDICRAEGLDLDEDYGGEKVVIRGDLILVSLTYVAQELDRRGIQETQR